MNVDQFVDSLHRKQTKIVGMFTGGATESDAKEYVLKHREKDGFIFHHFSGDPSDYFTAEATHSFMVVPGVWASAILRDFESVSLKGPSLATQEEKDSEGYTTDFLDGVYGVVFEMSVGEAISRLDKIDRRVNCRYRLVRFVLHEYNP